MAQLLPGWINQWEHREAQNQPIGSLEYLVVSCWSLHDTLSTWTAWCCLEWQVSEQSIAAWAGQCYAGKVTMFVDRLKMWQSLTPDLYTIHCLRPKMLKDKSSKKCAPSLRVKLKWEKRPNIIASLPCLTKPTIFKTSFLHCLPLIILHQICPHLLITCYISVRFFVFEIQWLMMMIMSWLKMIISCHLHGNLSLGSNSRPDPVFLAYSA